MERIKDFLFDLSDIAISLVIVVAIFFVVSWKLGETMPMSFAVLSESPFSKDNAANTPPVETGPPLSEAENPPVTESDGTIPATTSPNNAVTQAPQEPITDIPSEPVTAAPSPLQNITITIPSGSTGDAIAKILKSNGLIQDISAFNRTVESLGLGNKLRAGTFKLSTDMSLETMARRIAGFKN